MKLTDFYFEEKAQTGNHMAIPLRDGTDSGEWLNIVGSDSDVAVRGARNFVIGYRKALDSLSELEKQSKEKDDYLEYNLKLEDTSKSLNEEFAAALVNGWSFEDPFSKEALVTLLKQYSGLSDRVVAFYNEERRGFQEK